MTLDELITALEAADQERVVPYGFAHPHSFRGYYHELAFEPARDVKVGRMLADARSALGATYEGWKGGFYTMDGSSTVWIAREGESVDDPLTSLTLAAMLADHATLPTAVVAALRITLGVPDAG